jgi:hypothetical protein
MRNWLRYRFRSKDELACVSAALRPISVKRLCFLLQLSVLLLTLNADAFVQLSPPVPNGPNPWSGTWRLDIKRSSPVAAEEGVPQAYRLALGASGRAVVPIRWEIPELGEIVKGYTDGKPMNVQRTDPAPGLKLAVRTEGSRVLLYEVFRNGKLSGGGRMMLVDGGKAWIDLTWPQNRQDLAVELTYVKDASARERATPHR